MAVIAGFMGHAGNVHIEMKTVFKVLCGDDQMIDMIDYHAMIFA